MNEIVERFKQKNPGTDVAVNFSDVESYKTAIRNFPRRLAARHRLLVHTAPECARSPSAACSTI